MRESLLSNTECGLYCPAGDFYIDPWKPVERALITHAHADHLRWGHQSYLICNRGETVTRARLGPSANITSLPYGERLTIRDVTVSFHPAGHLLGSAQVRIEHQGQIWVVSGDYTTHAGNSTCEPFEPIRCHGFVTESTFGLPIYRWSPVDVLAEEINAWWRQNAANGITCIMYGYALGKAQRILSLVDPTIGPIVTHGAVEKLVQAYREAGVSLPATVLASNLPAKTSRGHKLWTGALVLAPPSTQGSPWLKKFQPYSSAMASGWMAIRGTRRRRSVDRGFVVSDHADWPGLLSAIRETQAETIWVTHGYTAVLVRWLREQGQNAETIATHFQGEQAAENDELAQDAVSPGNSEVAS